MLKLSKYQTCTKDAFHKFQLSKILSRQLRSPDVVSLGEEAPGTRGQIFGLPSENVRRGRSFKFLGPSRITASAKFPAPKPLPM